MVRLPVLVLVAALFLAVAPARADYEAGRAAWDAGDPAAELAEWLAAADGGAWEIATATWARKNGNCTTSVRVIRDGSWFSLSGNLRSATRANVNSGSRDDSLGFRVARTLAP